MFLFVYVALCIVMLLKFVFENFEIKTDRIFGCCIRACKERKDRGYTKIKKSKEEKVDDEIW